VVPFPGVEDDSLPEREEDKGWLFLSNDTPRAALKRRAHRGLLASRNALAVQAEGGHSGCRPLSQPGGPHRSFLSPHQGATG
jgi:hypothetical protein